jgi:hypothetical protein
MKEQFIKHYAMKIEAAIKVWLQGSLISTADGDE